jgi:hypothetical protein
VRSPRRGLSCKLNPVSPPSSLPSSPNQQPRLPISSPSSSYEQEMAKRRNSRYNIISLRRDGERGIEFTTALGTLQVFSLVALSVSIVGRWPLNFGSDTYTVSCFGPTRRFRPLKRGGLNRRVHLFVIHLFVVHVLLIQLLPTLLWSCPPREYLISLISSPS